MIYAIDEAVRRALRITIPAALIILALCIGIKTGSHTVTKIVYRQMPQQNGVLLLASAIESTPALKPIFHKSR